MEDLKFAKYFDYSLHLAHEIAGREISKSKNYQIAWKFNSNLLIADAFCYRKNKPFETIVDKYWQVDERPILYNENSSLLSVRNEFLDHFGIGQTFNSFDSLYSNGTELFEQLSNFVNTSKFTGAENLDKLLYNVKFIDSNVTLPFMNVSTKDSIRPVSLIESSQS